MASFGCIKMLRIYLEYLVNILIVSLNLASPIDVNAIELTDSPKIFASCRYKQFLAFMDIYVFRNRLQVVKIAGQAFLFDSITWRLYLYLNLVSEAAKVGVAVAALSA